MEPNRADGPPALAAHAIDTYYGRIQILHGLDLVLPKGQIVAIIGPNGAGKTTALKALFGLVPVKAGKVTLSGRDITNAKPERLVRQGLCFVPQGRAVFPSLSVVENLQMGAFVLRDKEVIRARLGAVFDRFPRLRERARQNGGSLSGGEQQMLAIGRSLMLEPKVMLLDEPSVGLAPRVVDEILESLIDLNKNGMTIGMVEQNATLALEVAHLAYLLVMGKNRMQGPCRELLSDPRVREIYLGGGAGGNPDEMTHPDERANPDA